MAGEWTPGTEGQSARQGGAEDVKLRQSRKTALPLVRAIGWASVATGAVAVGVFVGLNLRDRYRLNRRTPYDYYSHAGDNGKTYLEYGVGI